MISIHPIEIHAWPHYRDLRLRALLDSPDAFGSTHAQEVGRTDEAWSARAAMAASSERDRLLLAFDGDTPCGLLWCKLSVDEPGRADLYQMWVAPASRGKGAGRALLQAALSWAAQAGARRARLGVTVGDTPAMRLYLALGFVPVGLPEPLREGSHCMAQTMERALGPG